MKFHIVRKIKKTVSNPITVANALGSLGYYWTPHSKRPRTIDGMLTGIPKAALEKILIEVSR